MHCNSDFIKTFSGETVFVNTNVKLFQPKFYSADSQCKLHVSLMCEYSRRTERAMCRAAVWCVDKWDVSGRIQIPKGEEEGVWNLHKNKFNSNCVGWWRIYQQILAMVKTFALECLCESGVLPHQHIASLQHYWTHLICLLRVWAESVIGVSDGVELGCLCCCCINKFSSTTFHHNLDFVDTLHIHVVSIYCNFGMCLVLIRNTL